MTKVRVNKSILGKFRSVFRSDAGNVSMLCGIAAIPLVAAVGVAVDYMRAVRSASELQQVSDAAALAAASATNLTGTSSQKLAQRKTIAENFINKAVAEVSDIELIGSPVVTTGPNTVDVEVNAKVKGTLVNVLNLTGDGAETGEGDGGNEAGGNSSTDVDLKIKSKAGYAEDSYLCLLAMNPTQTESIYFQGNSEFMATCSVHANSNATVAIRTWGSAEAYAASFCARGGWSGSGFDPDPQGGCSYKDDPYNKGDANQLTLPTAGTCLTAAQMGLPSSGNGSKGSTTTGAFVKNESRTLPPGTYCGGIEGKTSGVITLQKGIYILKNGDLKLDAQSEIHAAAGTVIYLTGDSSNIDITSGATLQLVAPNDDNTTSSDPGYAYRGWAILHDRATGVGNTNTIYSKGGVDISGGIYQPSQKLVVWANGVMNDDSDYFPMIVNTLNMNGTSTLYVNLDAETAHLPDPTPLITKGGAFVSQ